MHNVGAVNFQLQYKYNFLPTENKNRTFETIYKEVMPAGVREDRERMEQLDYLYKSVHTLPNFYTARNLFSMSDKEYG